METGDSQQAIKAACFHPSGTFVEFKQDEIDQSIPDRFERIVRKNSDRIAVKSGNETFSYDVLNKASNRVAHAILAQRSEGEEPIALFFEQGTQVIAAIMGVLKAGKIYLPLDSSHPTARLACILGEMQELRFGREQVEKVLASLETLSDEEAQLLLAGDHSLSHKSGI